MSGRNEKNNLVAEEGFQNGKGTNESQRAVLNFWFEGHDEEKRFPSEEIESQFQLRRTAFKIQNDFKSQQANFEFEVSRAYRKVGAYWRNTFSKHIFKVCR